MTQALYHARELAMARMEEEADELGADGIVGVRLEVNLHAWGGEHHRVPRHRHGHPAQRRAAGLARPGNKPFQSDLSGQDFWTLLRAGYRPLGFVMGNCVYHIASQGMTYQMQQRNMEMPQLHAGPVRLARARHGAHAGPRPPNSGPRGSSASSSTSPTTPGATTSSSSAPWARPSSPSRRTT